MARFLAFLLFLFTIAFVLAARWYYVCHLKDFCGAAEPEPIVDSNTRMGGLNVYDGDSLIFSDYDQFAFPLETIAPDLNQNNRDLIDQLSNYLVDHPERNLLLAGSFRPVEQGLGSGFFENLGLARADAVRKYFTAFGLDASRVAINYKAASSDTLTTPLQLEIYAPALDTSLQKEAFVFENMTFSDANFAFDSDEFTPGSAFIAYADSLKTYLGLEPDKTVTIVGHTDNIDSDRYNLDLGERRAKSAAAYLEGMEITNQIIIETQGERQPVASNDSDQGRQRNRRVNFIIQ